jgi:hypothetical protein
MWKPSFPNLAITDPNYEWVLQTRQLTIRIRRNAEDNYPWELTCDLSTGKPSGSYFVVRQMAKFTNKRRR